MPYLNEIPPVCIMRTALGIKLPDYYFFLGKNG